MHQSTFMRARTSELPPALLTMPDFHGTLAAVRSLGRAAIPVTTADPRRLVAGAWSKYTTVRRTCPPVHDAPRFLEWLVKFGRQQEKHVLLPTCDDTAWMYSRHRDELSRYFHLGSPHIDVVHTVLNKRLLYAHAQAVGLATPRTWFPLSLDDLRQVAKEATFPLVVKPITQVLFEPRNKGELVHHPEDLEAVYQWFRTLPYRKELLAHDPSAEWPMLQEFLPEVNQGIYNISSYAHAGRLCGVRASRKLLQRPVRFGVGLCFEEAPLLADLAAALERLVARIGFSGVLEVEFIQTGGRMVLIDFNPRFYNQMAFDVARGLPLALLAYYDALNDEERMREAWNSVVPDPPTTGRVYVYSSGFKALLAMRRLSGVLRKEATAVWLTWYAKHKDRCVDPVSDPDDVWPQRIDHAELLKQCLRHPRGFVRSMLVGSLASLRSASDGSPASSMNLQSHSTALHHGPLPRNPKSSRGTNGRAQHRAPVRAERGVQRF